MATTQDNTELLDRIAGLQRSSRIAIPLSLIAFLAIMAMIYLSAQELAEKRDKIREADARLTQKKQEFDELRVSTEKLIRETQSRIESANRSIEQISRQTNQIETAQTAQKVIEELAVADASLIAAQKPTTVPIAHDRLGSVFGNMSIDVFYCEERGAEAKRIAEQIMALKADAQGRWRARPLTKAANSGDGYGLKANLIRHNADEIEVAQRLQKLARETDGIEFQLQKIAYPTPHYISAFVCGASSR
jgi:DNA repair exonuclease SbcCD ATPase subunit